MSDIWKRCRNCSYNTVCSLMVDEEGLCGNFKYDAKSERYGDLRHLAAPLCKWLKHHYPNDTKLIIDTNSVELVIQHDFHYIGDNYD